MDERLLLATRSLRGQSDEGGKRRVVAATAKPGARSFARKAARHGPHVAASTFAEHSAHRRSIISVEQLRENVAGAGLQLPDEAIKN
jgi:hypothetical protein